MSPDRVLRRLPRPARAARPRPVLLFIVYGVFLVIVGVTATAQVVLASTHFSTAVLNHTVGTDAQVVRGFVNEQLSPADLAGDVEPDRRLALEQSLRSFITRRGILHAEVRAPGGEILLSDVPVTGWAGGTSPDWQLALGGQVAVAIVEPDTSESAVLDLGTSSLLREYFPLLRDGRTVAVVGIWRDAEPITESLGTVRRDVVLVTMTAAVAAAIVLFLVFRSAQGRISRQTIALLESTRRDALTGLLNHGSLLEGLAETTERLRRDGGGLAIALLDIDNFRNFNDTWGHGAGDQAILTVADLLLRAIGDDVVLGRYGPDEFLVVAERLSTAELVARLEGVGRALAAIDLRFEGSERLPVTLSGAVSAYPDHGESVTELLAATAVTLREAKASGGDAILATGASVQESAETRTFDVFQGLILAVDAKDRYTKRHSEDVARYALFLASRIGLPADELSTVRMAGLLHDVGKIGIPDHILRKPGKLTDAEFAIVQQHVALGDAIVRDLPNLDGIRAGIRHHHERWDGAGYLHRLEGEEIPLVARILAVCDTFSAMTTSRPYRKALDLREALFRLQDAAGTQLDERLVIAFVAGIETDANPPLPGDEGPASLWLPEQGRIARVA